MGTTHSQIGMHPQPALYVLVGSPELAVVRSLTDGKTMHKVGLCKEPIDTCRLHLCFSIKSAEWILDGGVIYK